MESIRSHIPLDNYNLVSCEKEVYGDCDYEECD